MIAGFRARALAFALLLPGLPGPAAAQDVLPPAPPGGEMLEPLQPPDTLPRIDADKTRGLDFLFDALKAAPDAEAARFIENRIWAQWMRSGSDTAGLLMSRVREAVQGQDLDLAVRLLDALVQVRPDYVEGWNRRATLHFLQKDFSRAMADLEQVLRREPRHFGALSGVGIILQEFGRDQGALDAFRRALSIHPHLQRVPEIVKRLSEKVEGRDI